MQPMLATRGDRVPTGEDWLHEVKWDGMRVLVEIAAGRVRVWSRNENDVSVSFPELQELSGLVGVHGDLLLDGEVVALRSGAPSFSDLAERMHVKVARRAEELRGTNPVTFICFDVLRRDGTDLTGTPLAQRRTVVESLRLDDPVWLAPPAYDDGELILQAARDQGLEGIVSKRRASRYRPGVRSRDWLKFPIRPTGSFVVGGFRREKGSSGDRIGAVLVGAPTPRGLVFRGRVGSGLAGKAARLLAEQVRVRESSPFATPVPRLDAEGTVWCEPVLVVDVDFLTMTGDGRLRQPAYRGIRTDLTPDDLEDS